MFVVHVLLHYKDVTDIRSKQRQKNAFVEQLFELKTLYMSVFL